MFLITFFTWWQHLFRPFQLILSLVLGVLVLVLLIVEVSSIFNSAGTDSASTATNLEGDNRNEAKLKKFLKFTERVGLMVLYHPVGKTIYLAVCGALCWVIGGPADYLLGLLFFLNAAVLLYCWTTYPEFRRTFDPPAADDGERPDTGPAPRSASWSMYSSSFQDHVSEKAPLVGGAPMRKGESA